MKEIGLNEISKITFGARKLIPRQEGIDFARMPEEQIALMRQVNEDYELRARNNAGIFLDFMTDSRDLEISLRMLHDYEGCQIVLEVLEDGEPAGILEREKTLSGSGRLSIRLSPGEKRVTVFLSAMTRIALSALRLSDGAEVQPLVKKRKLLFLGDSITQGYHPEHPAKAFPNQIAWRTDSDLINLGIGGARFDPRILDSSLTYPADHIFVSYGTNDWKHAECSEEFRTYPGAFMQKLRKMYPQTPIDLILPLWRKESEIPGFGNGDFQEARRYYARCAEKAGMRVIDTWDFVPHEEMYFFDKKLHPNDKGCDLLSEALLEAAGELLKS